MDVNLIRKIFGEMPVEYLPAAKIVRKKNITTGIMIAIGVTMLVGGFWAGTKWQKRKDKEFKLPEIDHKEAENLPKKSKENKEPKASTSKKGTT